MKHFKGQSKKEGKNKIILELNFSFYFLNEKQNNSRTTERSECKINCK